MRKPYLFLLGIAGVAGFAAAAIVSRPEKINLPADFDPWNLNNIVPIEKLEKPEVSSQGAFPLMQPMREAKDGETMDMFVAAQKFHDGTTFVYQGGATTTYHIGLTIDGEKAIISNLFNLEAQSTEWSQGVDYDVVGKYDADAKTITINTPNDFWTGTIVGTIGGFYTELLLSGTVSETGGLTPSDKLVFNIVGDFEALTTDQNFLTYNYSPDGSYNFGAQTVYRKFYAALPTDEPCLITFNDTFDLGEAFPGITKTHAWPVFNMSGVSVDYFLDIDGEAFSVEAEDGIIAPMTMKEIMISFNPMNEGDYTGSLTLEYGGNEKDPDPLTASFTATCVGMPDYSLIVKEGEFSFDTSTSYPFVITTLSDGTQVARSTTNGEVGTSTLTVKFEVPQGQIGVFSWKGESANTGQWYSNAAGYFIDDNDLAEAVYYDYTNDISGSHEFGPGTHTVRFQYEGAYFTGDAANGMYVYDLSLESAPADENLAIVLTPEIYMGYGVIYDGAPVYASGEIKIMNRGANPLEIYNVNCDNQKFTIGNIDDKPALLETLSIPVNFSSDEEGAYHANVTMESSAGELKAELSIKVIDMPDFKSLVVEGAEIITEVSTNDYAPFVIENGVARNLNSGDPDLEQTMSWFQINFEVPQGKAAYLSWDGELDAYCQNMYEYWNGEYAQIDIYHTDMGVMGSMGAYAYQTDAGSDIFRVDSYWESYLTCIPGNHNVRFNYNRNGDGLISETDRLSISNIRLHLVDFDEYKAEASVEWYTFEEPIYCGENRYTKAEIYLTNLGSMPLEVLDVKADGPFFGEFTPGQTATYSNNLYVNLGFYPEEEGEFSGSVTFVTTAGDITVDCFGETLSSEGILLIGDAENHGIDWTFYPQDADRHCWNMGYDLWFGYYASYVHSGVECFGSPSYDYTVGGFEPNAWLISPVVSVPADGGVLQWFAAPHYMDKYAEHYSVYITDPETAKDYENLENLTPVFEKTLDEPEDYNAWEEQVIDLSNYAGQDIVILFRHHDCSDQFVLKLDDIFVFTNERWNGSGTGVDNIAPEAIIVEREIYDVNGTRVERTVNGVNIVRDTYSDGTVKTHKIFVK